jgi:hypothetical protein
MIGGSSTPSTSCCLFGDPAAYLVVEADRCLCLGDREQLAAAAALVETLLTQRLSTLRLTRQQTVAAAVRADLIGRLLLWERRAALLRFAAHCPPLLPPMPPTDDDRTKNVSSSPSPSSPLTRFAAAVGAGLPAVLGAVDVELVLMDRSANLASILRPPPSFSCLFC